MIHSSVCCKSGMLDVFVVILMLLSLQNCQVDRSQDYVNRTYLNLSMGVLRISQLDPISILSCSRLALIMCPGIEFLHRLSVISEMCIIH